MENHQSQPEQVSFRTWFSWALLFVAVYLIIAFAFWHRTLIGTETWALYYAGQPLAEQMQSIRGDLVHPPLIYMVERLWFQVFGHSDNAAKSLPLVIVPVLIILLTYLAAKVTPHWRWLTLFMCCLYFRPGSSPNLVRMYGLFLLLTVAAVLLWDRWREQPRNATLVAWVVVMTALLYTHLFGGLLLIGFVVLNWLFGARRWPWTFAAAIPGILFFPWFFYVLPVYSARGLDSNLTWASQRLDKAVASFFPGLLASFRGLDSDLRVPILLVGLGIHVLLLGLLWLGRHRVWPIRAASDASQRWFFVTAVLFAVPFAIMVLVSAATRPVIELRWLIALHPLYWIAVFLICEFSGRAGRMVLYGLILPWVLLSVASSMWYYRQPNWQRLDAAFVAQRYRPTDLLLCEDPDNANAIYWEWNKRLHLTARIEVIPTAALAPMSLSILKPVELEKIDLTGVDRVWLFLEWGDKRKMITEYLGSRGFVLDEHAAEAVPKLLLFVRKPDR